MWKEEPGAEDEVCVLMSTGGKGALRACGR